MVHELGNPTPITAMIASAPPGVGAVCRKPPEGLSKGQAGTDLKEEVPMEDSTVPGNRSILDWFANESRSVLAVSGILLTTLVMLKIVAYNANPTITSVLNYISALAQ